MSGYPTSSLGSSTAHILDQYEPRPSHVTNTPWNPSARPRTPGQFDEQNNTLFREVDLLEKVIVNGTTPSILVLEDLLTRDHFKLLKDNHWVCLICAFHPAEPREIPKSRKKTKGTTKVHYKDKADLLQHINNKHLRAFVCENYLFEECKCLKRHGMAAARNAHSKDCAKICKTNALDKPTHQELEHMAEELRKAGLNVNDPMVFLESALSVLFDEVDGAPTKRYDLSDGTDNLMLRPRIDRSTAGVADGALTSASLAHLVDLDPEQALRNAIRVYLNNGPLGRQKVRDIVNEMTVGPGINQRGPPSEQTQPLNAEEQLARSRKRKYAPSSPEAVSEDTTPLAPTPPVAPNPHYLLTTQLHTAQPSLDVAHNGCINPHELDGCSEDCLSMTPDFKWSRGLQYPPDSEPDYFVLPQDWLSEDDTSGRLDGTGDTSTPNTHYQ